MALGELLVVTLLQNENFNEIDVINAARSLRAYAIGLLAFMAIKIFAPGYYARQNTKTPVKIGVIAMATNMVLNLLFYLNGLAHVGLALATSLAAMLNATLLIIGLSRAGVFNFHPGWLIFLLRLLVANAVMAYFLISLAGDWEVWSDWDMLSKILRLALLVGGGILIYGGMLLLTGLRGKHVYRELNINSDYAA